MSLQAKEHTGGAGTGPLELFCSPVGIPPTLASVSWPPFLWVQAGLQGVLQQAKLCKREACITGALTNS